MGSRQWAVGSGQFTVGSQQELASSIEHPVSSISQEDQAWLEAVENLINTNIENTHFNITQLTADLQISRSQLFRRLKQLTGLSPKQYIKTIRFTKARTLLENKTYATVKAVALSVGLKDVVHFSRQFKQQFGRLPPEYLE